MQKLGFQQVTISNLFHAEKKDHEPFEWSYQDVEALQFPDNSFDFCIVHDGLHHCASPHRGLLELYRVAKLGVLAFEPPDSWVTRIAIKCGLAQEYEAAAVAGHAYQGGGWRNTVIPNYVHRWTRREVRHAISSFAPHVRHDYLFVSGAGFNLAGKLKSNSRLIKMLGRGIASFMQMGCQLFPSLGNLFSFAIIKPLPGEGLQPWLKPVARGIALDSEWFRRRRFPNPEKADAAVFYPPNSSHCDSPPSA